MAETDVTFQDNSPATAPDGTKVHGDLIAGSVWQYVKLAGGTPDSTEKIQGTEAFGLEVDVTRVTGTVTTATARPASSTVTSVNDTASSTTLLASNANRLGATIYNDSTVDLYLKLGATASLTSFTVKMAADGYYEVPFGFTGEISGIWSSDTGGGVARISELSA